MRAMLLSTPGLCHSPGLTFLCVPGFGASVGIADWPALTVQAGCPGFIVS